MPDWMIHRLVFLLRFALGIGLLSFSIQACGTAATGLAPTAATSSGTAENILDPTETLQPSPTSEPDQVILLAPAGAGADQTAALQVVLQELAVQSGMVFQTSADISQVDFNKPVRVVVVLPPDPGLADLAASHADTQFLGIGISGLQPSQNLSIIGAQGDRPDRQGFIAGYLAAVISEDWRIGVISLSDSPAGQAARLGFINGVIFYCGLCRPVYPPFIQYPQYAEITSGAGQAEWQAAADVLISNAVKTIYVYPGAGGASLLAYLAQAGVNIIGGMPPGAELADRWVATIQTDLPAAIREVWPSFIRGEGGKNLPIPIIISHRNEQLFSLGRQGLVEKMLEELLSDYVDTGVDPLTGVLK